MALAARPRAPHLTAVLLSGLFLAACGDTEIDSGKVEGLIRENVAEPKPRKVECPDGVKAEKGKTFECKLDYPGGKPATVTVHIDNEDGRVRFGPEDLRTGE